MDAQRESAADLSEGGLIGAVRRAGRAAVVSLRGELHVAQREELENAVAELQQEGMLHIVLDLAALDFIGSAGLGALVSLQKSARSAGGSVRIAAARPTIVSLMSLTRLDHLIPLHATIAEAESAI